MQAFQSSRGLAADGIVGRSPGLRWTTGSRLLTLSGSYPVRCAAFQAMILSRADHVILQRPTRRRRRRSVPMAPVNDYPGPVQSPDVQVRRRNPGSRVVSVPTRIHGFPGPRVTARSSSWRSGMTAPPSPPRRTDRRHRQAHQRRCRTRQGRRSPPRAHRAGRDDRTVRPYRQGGSQLSPAPPRPSPQFDLARTGLTCVPVPLQVHARKQPGLLCRDALDTRIPLTTMSPTHGQYVQPTHQLQKATGHGSVNQPL